MVTQGLSDHPKSGQYYRMKTSQRR